MGSYPASGPQILLEISGLEVHIRMALQLNLPKRFGGSEVRSISAPPSPDRITLVGGEVEDELYRPLSPWQTRLIQLLPGDEIDDVECRLEVADVTAEDGLGLTSEIRLQVFEALSCPHSPTDRKTTLTCNGMSIDVSTSVFQALRFMRHKTDTRWLWCDALCINPDNLEEKAVQLRKSLLIFEKAESVIGWLGMPDTDAEAVFDAVDYSPDAGRYDPVGFLASLQAFLSRPWFRWLWSRQATIATRDLVLQCGHYAISFHNFCRFALKAGARGSIEVLYGDHLEESKRPSHCYDKTLADVVHEVMSKCHLFDFSDPRDCVYSSVALIDKIWKKAGRKSCLKDLPVDYSSPFGEACEDLMVFLINEERSLAALNILGSRDLSGTLPSWIGDWRQPGLCLPLERRDCGRQLPPMFVKDGKLTLFGAFVGTIAEELEWVAEPAIDSCGSPRLRHRRSSSNISASLIKHRDKTILDLCSTGSYSFRTVKFADGTRSSAVGVAVPVEALPGDEIAVMHGCSAPFVLRWCTDGFQVVGAAWMWSTFSARSHEDELHHYCDFDSWASVLYRSECNESIPVQANIRRALKTTSWHRRYWLETGQIHAEKEARLNNFASFQSHKDWIEHAEAGNAIREYMLC